MNRGFLTYSLFIATVLLPCSGCREKIIPDGPEHGEHAMSFSTEVLTKGVTATNDNLKNQSIGIYGTYSSTPGGDGRYVFENGDGVTELKFGDYNLEGFSGTDAWYYEPLQYWKRNQYYRFRAFYPYRFADGKLNEGEPGLLESASDTDQILVNYSMTPGKIDNVNNYDLLVAFGTRNTGTDGGDDKMRFSPVTLKFEHALAALKFEVTYAEDNGYTGTLTKFWINGLRSTGWMTYSYAGGNKLEPALDWSTYNYTSNKDYFLWEGSGSFTYNKPVNVYVTAENSEGLIFVVPQVCSEERQDGSGTDITSVSFMTKKSGDAINTVVLDRTEWEPGKKYTYTLKMGTSNIIVNVTSEDWEVLESDITIDI